jgi:hypothetical protein
MEGDEVIAVSAVTSGVCEVLVVVLGGRWRFGGCELGSWESSGGGGIVGFGRVCLRGWRSVRHLAAPVALRGPLGGPLGHIGMWSVFFQVDVQAICEFLGKFCHKLDFFWLY